MSQDEAANVALWQLQGIASGLNFGAVDLVVLNMDIEKAGPKLYDCKIEMTEEDQMRIQKLVMARTFPSHIQSFFIDALSPTKYWVI